MSGLYDNMSNTTGVQFPNRIDLQTPAQASANRVVNAGREVSEEINLLERRIRELQKINNDLVTRLRAYDRVVCAEPFGVRWAVAGVGTIPSIDPKKVGDVLEENKRLRADLESLVKDQNIAAAQHLKEIDILKKGKEAAYESCGGWRAEVGRLYGIE